MKTTFTPDLLPTPDPSQPRVLEENLDSIAESMEQPPQADPFVVARRFRRRLLAVSIVPTSVVVALILAFGSWQYVSRRGNEAAPTQLNKTDPENKLDLSNLPSLSLTLSQAQYADQVTINGKVVANGSLVLTPSVQPNAATAGQLYYDSKDNQIKIYDGSGFRQVLTTDGTSSICYVGADCGFATATGTVNLPQGLAVTDAPTFAGLTLTSPLSISSGGTGASSFASNGVLLGNAGGAFISTNAPIAAQVLVADGSGKPQFVTFSGDISISPSGVTNLGNNTVGGNELVNSGVIAGTYGDGSTYPVFSVDADGRITGASTLVLPGGGSPVTSVNTLFGALSVVGTADEINVVSGGTTITLSTPQPIAATSSPTFAGLTIIGGVGAASFSGDGSALTSLNASNLSSGTVNDLRLSGNVALLNNAQTFTALKVFGAGATVSVGQSLTVNGDALTDLTGTGLVNSGGSLQSTLGTSVDVTSEITGTVSLGNGGTNAVTAQGAIDNLSGLTTNGDVLYFNGTNTARLPRGTNGDCLVSNATTILWGNCAGSGTTFFTIQGTSGVSQPINGGDTVTIAAGTNISTTGSAVDTITVSVVSNPSFTGLVSLQGGATISPGQNFTINGDAFTDLTGTGIIISGGSLQATLGTNIDLTAEVTGILPVANGGTNANNAITARSNLGAAASGANSDIISLSGLTTALSVDQGGTGAVTLGADGVLLGNGVGAITSVVAGGAGLCLTSTAGAPIWDTCPGSAGSVASLNTLTGALSIQGTVNQVAVADNGTDTVTLSLPQDIAVGSSPTFNGLTLTSLTLAGDTVTDIAGTGLQVVGGALQTTLGTNVDLTSEVTGITPIANGGTNANDAVTARTNLGAAASGANSDITSLSGLTTALSILQGGTAATTSQGAIDNLSGLTTNGDLLYHSGTNSTRLGRGGNGDCLQSNATTILWGSCAGTGTTFFTLAGTGGTPQPINGGDTVTVAAGSNITTTAGATDTVTIDVVGNPTFSGLVTSVGLTAGAGLIQGTNGLTITGNTSLSTTAGNTITAGNSTGVIALTGSNGSTFIFNGVTVDVTEFNLLNGRDTALVDTTDAVATAITGTGALNAGSITSGFGTIDIGADTITSGLINGQTISSSANFTGTLDVTGTVSLTSDLAVNGNTTIGNATTDRLTVVSQVLGASPLVFQGVTDNGFSTTFAFTDPTANNTITFPDSSGTVCTSIGNCAGVGGVGDILNNGQNGSVRIGSNDGNSTILESNNIDRLTITSAGDATFSGTLAVTGRTSLNSSASIKAGASTVLTGSIDPAANTTVTGVGTFFLSELLVGDNITVSGETRTVTAIASDTSLTVHTAFSDNANDTSPDRVPAALIVQNNAGTASSFINPDVDSLSRVGSFQFARIGALTSLQAISGGGLYRTLMTINTSDAVVIQGISGLTITGGNTTATKITTGAAGLVGLIVRGAASQSADVFQLQDSNTNVNAAFNATGAELTLGRVAGSGTVTQGKLLFSDGTTDNLSLTLQSTTLTGSNKTVTFPDATGTVCLTTGNCSGIGGTGDILNNGQNGSVRIGSNDGNSTVIESNNVDRLSITSAGNATITGGTTGDTLTVNNSTSVGNIFVAQDNGTPVFTIADGGAVTSSSNITIQGGSATLGTASQAGSLIISDGSSNTDTILAASTSGDYTFTIPTVAANDTFCLVTLANCGGASGVTSVGTIDTPTTTADGAHITGTVLYLQSATASVPGLVNTGTQTFAGAKTFNSAIIAPTATDTINGLIINAGAISGATTINASGLVTSVGLTAGAGLIQGTAGLTITGNTSLSTTAGNTTSIGNTTGVLTLTGATGNTFNFNGVIVDTTEFNLLNGRDTQLVDTTDAVATAITGTGALNAGSITSGFGTIDTGADAISTTGTISSGIFNASGLATLSGGLTVTGATANINDSSNFATNINTGTSTGAVNIGNSLSGAITLDSAAGTIVNYSLTTTGAALLYGNTTIGNATTDRLTVTSQILGGSPLVFQGTTDNGFATTFAFTDPTANNTITFPDSSGTVCTTIGNCAGVSGVGDILNNGQNGSVRIGSNDGNSTILETNNVDRLTITSGGNATLTGGTTGDTLTVNNSTSSGNIFVAQDNGTPVFTIADGGSVSSSVASSATTSFKSAAFRLNDIGVTVAADVAALQGVAAPASGAAGYGSTNIIGVLGGASNSANNVGTIAAFMARNNTFISGTITNAYGLLAQDAVGVVGGTITNQAGVAVANQTNATNNTNLLLGTTTIPAGQFSIYNSSTNQNVFAGNLRVGSTTAPTVALDVTGAALISTTLGVTSNLTVDTNTLFVDATNNKVGIGTATPNTNTGVLEVTGTPGGTYNTVALVAGSTTSTTAKTSLHAQLGVAPSGASAAIFRGLSGVAYSTSANTSGATLIGVSGEAQKLTGGTLGTAVAGRFTVAGIDVGAITNGFGLQASNPSLSLGATLTNGAGISVEEQSAATNNTNLLVGTTTIPAGQFSIYNSSTNQNVFAGNLRVGSTTAPTVALDVTGAALISTTLGVSGATTLSGAGSSLIFSGVTTDITTAANESLTVSPNGTGDIVLSVDDDTNLQITGTITNDGSAQNVALTLGADANVDTVAGINIAVTSAATGDQDVLQGLNIANLTSADATVIERALQIGSNWDAQILFNDTTTLLQVANTGTITFEDDAGNDLFRVIDNGSTGTAYANGSLTVHAPSPITTPVLTVDGLIGQQANGVVIDPDFAPTSAGASATVVSITGSANDADLTGTYRGLYVAPLYTTASATLSNFYSIQTGASVNNSSATYTNYVGLQMSDPSGLGTVVNNYGINIANKTKGTNDYGIYIQGADTYALWADAGISRFDGLVRAGAAGTNGTATGDGDLYVQDALEVDGEAVLTTVSGAGLSSCSNGTTEKLLYDSGTKIFSCGTDQTGGGGLSASLTDNIADAWDIQQGTDNYFNINTTNSFENISFGNAATNPSYSFLGSGTLSVTGSVSIGASSSLRVVGGNTASRPGSPTEGMIYFDTTTKQLLTYANGKWQQDRTDAVLVAASNSSQSDKDAADYVADGNTGSANDGDQIQINSALTAGSGKKVVLLAGTYVADATISIPNNTTLAGVGQGTIIELADLDATENLIENTTTTGGTGITIRDMKLDGRDDLNTAGTQIGIYLNSASNSSLENIAIEDFRNGSIVLDDASDHNNIIGVSSTSNPFNSGITIEANSNFNTVSSSTISGSGGDGLFVDDSEKTTITGNTFGTNNTGASIRLDNGTWLTTITGNTIYGGTSNFGIQVTSSSGSNTITGNAIYNQVSIGILILGPLNVVTNNYVEDAPIGIDVEGNDNSVQSNTVWGTGGSTDFEGIKLITADSNQILNNHLYDDSCSTTCYGINISNVGSDDNYVSGNVFNAAIGTATINNAGTGTTFANQTTAENGLNTVFSQANSTSAFAIQNSSGTNILNVDTTNSRITIGTSDTTGTLFVLDTKTGSGDPTGVNGGMYYNSNTNKFRCYENSTWVDCVSSGSGVTTVGAIDTTPTAANGARISGSSIFMQYGDATYPGLISTTSQTIAGNKTFNGRVTLNNSATIKAATTSVLTGSIDPAASTTVTGVSTLFLTELQVGDRITVTGETRTVTAIASNTSLTVDTAFSNNANDTSPDRLPAALVVNNSAGTNILAVSDIGELKVQTSTNSANALQVLDSTGTSGLKFDTALSYLTVSSNFASAIDVAYLDSHNLASGGNLTIQASNTGVLSLSADGDVSVTSNNGNILLGASNTTGTLFVLDTKTNAGDPTGAAGGMYYNSNSGKLRCYEVTTWKDCITTDTGVTTVGSIDTTPTAANGARISGSSIFMQYGDATYPGLISTTSQTIVGAKTLTSELKVGGNSNTSQLIVKANASQSNTPLITVQNSSNTEISAVRAPDNSSIAVGFNAGYVLTTSQASAFFGSYSGDSSTGVNNTGVGYGTLQGITTSTDNTAVGAYALATGIAGNYNSAFGSQTLQATTGANNTALGFGAGNAVVAGSNNVLVGYNAGSNLTSGSDNVIIGYNLGASAAGVSNELRIGGVLQGSTSTLAAQFNGALTVVGATNLNGNITLGDATSDTITFTGRVNSDILPSADDTYNLGDDTHRFANIYLGGETIHLGTSTSDEAAFSYTTGTNVLSLQSTGTISLASDTVLAASKSLTITGGNTASRPGSPTDGMVYYDTTTNQLITYDATLAKWKADHSAVTKIVAANNSSQAMKDAADYVADGTDDQVEINTALTAASGGKVYLAEGTYVTHQTNNGNATILIPNNTTLAGAGRGTVIELGNLDVTENLIENSDTLTGTGVTIQDMRIDGRNDLNTAGTQYGIVFNNMGAGTGSAARQGGRINNVIVEDFRSEGIRVITSLNNIFSNNTLQGNTVGIDITTSSSYNTLTGTLIEGGTTGIGILSSSTYNSITGNTVQGTSNAGMSIDASSNNTISNNTVQGNTFYNILLSSTSSGNTITGNTSVGSQNGININTSTNNNNMVSGNNVSTASVYGIYIGGNTNTVTGNTVTAGASSGITSAGSYNTITGNTVSGNANNGIGLVFANSTVVSSNKIHDNGGATTNQGIVLTSADNNTITSNSITDTACTIAFTCYAISITNSASDVNYLADNWFTGSSSTNQASINDVGTGTIYAGQFTAGQTLQSSSSVIKSIASSTATGFVDPTASTTLTSPSTSTRFLTELQVGDRITVNGETRTVVAVATDYSLTVDVAFTNTANANYTRLPAALVVKDSANNVTLAVKDNGNVGIGTVAPSAKLEVGGVTGSTVAAIINNGSSTGNILDLQDNGTSVFMVADGGATTFQNQTDSTAGFRVMDADGGTPIISVDTTNERVGIGTSPGANTVLTVGGTVTTYTGSLIKASGNITANNGTAADPASGINGSIGVAPSSTGSSATFAGILSEVFTTNLNFDSTSNIRAYDTFIDAGVGAPMTLGNAWGYSARANFGLNLTADEYRGVNIANATGSGTLTNNYGLYVENLTKGTSDYGIYVAGADTYALFVDAGATRLDGTLEVANITPVANLTIGTSDTTGTLLVLDTKTGAGDPTGANGAMYYNSNSNKFRCYQNSAWTDCIGSGGGGGATKTIIIPAEYAGSTLHADGTNNSGTLTSDYDSTNLKNYYDWTTAQTSLQDYEVITQSQIPSDYASGFGTFKVWAYANSTSSANNDIQVTVVDASGTSCAAATSILPGSASTWTQQTVTLSGCSYAANDVVSITIKVLSKSSNNVRIGAISYQYTN